MRHNQLINGFELVKGDLDRATAALRQAGHAVRSPASLLSIFA
jgi:hypothetical protein